MLDVRRMVELALLAVLAVGVAGPARADEPRTVKGKIKTLRCLALTPDGKTVALGGDSTTVEVWDTTTGRLRRLLKDHPGQIWSLAVSPDGNTLTVGSYRHTLLWDLGRGEKLATLKGHTENVSGLLFSPDGKKVVTVSAGEEALKVWEVSTGKELASDRSWIHFCVLSPDGKVLCKLLQGRFVARDLATWKKLGANPGLGYVSDLASFSSDNRTLAVNSRHDLVLWDVLTGKHVGGHSLHTGTITAVAYSPDGKTLATGSRDKTAILWDAATKRERATLEGHPGPVVVLFARDGRTLFTFTPGDRTVKLWDVASGKARGSFQGCSGGIEALHLSADGTMLAVRGRDHSVTLHGVARALGAAGRSRPLPR
jgi:WD40 repeat protein